MVYVEIDVLGRYICVYERVCMDLDYMAWYISFPQYVLQILVVTMRVRSLFKITISGTSARAQRGELEQLQIRGRVRARARQHVH